MCSYSYNRARDLIVRILGDYRSKCRIDRLNYRLRRFTNLMRFRKAHTIYQTKKEEEPRLIQTPRMILRGCSIFITLIVQSKTITSLTLPAFSIPGNRYMEIGQTSWIHRVGTRAYWLTQLRRTRLMYHSPLNADMQKEREKRTVKGYGKKNK